MTTPILSPKLKGPTAKLPESGRRNRRIHVAMVSTFSPAAHNELSAEGGVATYTKSLLEAIVSDTVSLTLVANEGASTSCEAADVRPTWEKGRLSSFPRLSRAIEEVRPDVLHVQHELFLFGGISTALAFPLWLRAISRSMPTIVTVHGVPAIRDLGGDILKRRARFLPAKLVKAVVGKVFAGIASTCATFVVHEESLRGRLEEYGAKAERINVIPIMPMRHAACGAELLSRKDARIRLGIGGDADVVLSYGYDNIYKSYDRLVEGFALAKSRIRNIQLVLGVGPHPARRSDASYIKAYNETAKQWSGVEGVSCVGFIPDSLVELYVRAADAVIFPYNTYVAASGPMSTAIGLRTPILASDIFRDLPEEIRFECSRDGIAQAIEAFFANRNEATKIVAKLAAGRTPESIGSAYATLYERVTNAPTFRNHGG